MRGLDADIGLTRCRTEVVAQEARGTFGTHHGRSDRLDIDRGLDAASHLLVHARRSGAPRGSVYSVTAAIQKARYAREAKGDRRVTCKSATTSAKRRAVTMSATNEICRN